MSRMLSKMNLMSVVQKLLKEDIETIQGYVEMIEEENKQLKEKLDKYENPEDMTLFAMWCTEKVKDENLELKKQLEEWKHHLKCSKEMLDIQGQKGNYDYDEYMLGLYNGMEYIIALFETREPNYISGKDVEFTNNRTKQKEFIKYLEDESKEVYRDGGLRQNIFRQILQKYKSIMGVSDENNKQ